MAINSTMTWFNRVSGNQINGGGFDPSIAGGTNYADQNAAQLAITDLASTASTTMTSAIGGFTAAMVGNVIRLASGTGTPTAGYYTILTYTDTNNVVVDRVSGTFTAGVAKLGGAHATLVNYTNGGSGLPTPLIATPIVAGNKVYIRSAGSVADPAIGGTPDYDYSAGYWTIPSGSAAGTIQFLGLGISELTTAKPLYRPLIKYSALLFNNTTHKRISNIKFFTTSTPAWSGNAVTTGDWSLIDNNIFDTNGAVMKVIELGNTSEACFNVIKNSGSKTSSLTYYAIGFTGFVASVFNNVIVDFRGQGINATNANTPGSVIGNIIANCSGIGISISGSPGVVAMNNTVYNCGDHGISINPNALPNCTIINNTVSKIPASKYAYSITSGTVAGNDSIKGIWAYNNAFLDGGAGGLYNLISAGSTDLNLDPQFTNAGTLDFSVGTNMKAACLGLKF